MTGFVLMVNETKVLNVTMEQAAVEEEVTVVAQPPLIETTKSESTTVVTDKEVESLPLLTRQFANLAKKALGFSSERGDQFEISCAPLASQPPEGVVATSALPGWQESLGSTVKIGLIVLAILGALMFLLKRRPHSDRRTLLEGPSGSVLTQVHESATALSREIAAPLGLPGEKPRVALPDAVNGQEITTQLINEYPDRAIEVLRLWLHEKEVK